MTKNNSVRERYIETVIPELFKELALGAEYDPYWAHSKVELQCQRGHVDTIIKAVNAHGHLQGRISVSLYSGPFLESCSLLWPGYITSVIQSALCSTGCCSTTLRSFSQNMSHDLKESIAFFALLLRKSLRSASTGIRTIFRHSQAVIEILLS